ncbi:ceramide glucosyltransferase [Enterovirga aerilata]|uniref:Glycosyltransferase n=1 Tax=Enterovirga aerilata TaxID=2730920 RepID=A0A849IAG0_9HYPH|nr:ceramide glucosyltransferase [Enterovirga sp. DB1703]NNM73399.1 glycosyltransferase [Enterovirga sp. DB1703]
MTGAFWAGAFCLAATVVNLVSLAVAAIRIRGPRAPLPVGADPPPVSIVRPVCGIETFSEKTLRSGFELDYPDYELIFCVARASDPIVPLVQKLMAAYPAIPSQLIIGDERISENPKLNNCVRGWEAARHDWVILADSNVLMPRDYVQRLRASWRPDTGLVCSTPAGSHPDGFWAEVECAFLNTLQARWQYAGEALGFGFAQGKSMLWRKDILEARGGIRALAAEIAEDAAATKLVRKAGLHVHLVDAPFQQPLGPRTAAEVWYRQLRWARLRRVTFPLFFAPEISSGAVLPMAAGALWAASAGWSVIGTVLAVALFWYGPEFVLARLKGWPLSRRSLVTFVVRDLMILPMWAYAWVAVRIEWRGNAMSVRTKAAEALRATGTAV